MSNESTEARAARVERMTEGGNQEGAERLLNSLTPEERAATIRQFQEDASHTAGKAGYVETNSKGEVTGIHFGNIYDVLGSGHEKQGTEANNNRSQEGSTSLRNLEANWNSMSDYEREQQLTQGLADHSVQERAQIVERLQKEHPNDITISGNRVYFNKSGEWVDYVNDYNSYEVPVENPDIPGVGPSIER